MNFNGTAGIWRKRCIEDAGGWQANTLVEDVDLSYRAQMRGWRALFLDKVVCNGELPVEINAAKRQQFRWAKGSIQLAIKLLGDIMMDKKLPADTKIQAFVQLTRHIVHPLMLIQFLLLPLLLAQCRTPMLCMSSLLEDKVYMVLSDTVKRGVYPLHAYRYGLFRIPAESTDRKEIQSVVTTLKQAFKVDEFADRIYVTHKWKESDYTSARPQDWKEVELEVTVEIVTGDVVDIIYQIKPLEYHETQIKYITIFMSVV